MIESETVEFKKSTSELKEGVVSIVAILNKHGKGELYFGIMDSGKIAGQDVSQATIREVSQAISGSIEPKIYPEIEKIIIEGKYCVKVAFQGQDTPYYAYGRAYIRVGDEDKKLDAKSLEKFIIEKKTSNNLWDNKICNGAKLGDIDVRSLKKFISFVKQSKRLDITSEKKDVLLKKLGLMHDNKMTNASILLFGKDPKKFFHNTFLRCGRFKDNAKEEFFDIKDFDGNIFENLDSSIKFLQDHLRVSARIEGLLRREKWEIPIEALREAMINALIHRDYLSSGFTYIEVYDSEIIIKNPGQLPKQLTIKSLYVEHGSFPKNPLLAQILYYTGLIDIWGRGTVNISRTLSKEGLEKPIFDESSGYFRIIFKRPKKAIGDTLGEKLGEKLGENFLKIMQLIQENKHVTTKQLSEKIGISTTAIDNNILKLKKKGLIKRIGPDKGGYWEINN